MKKNSSLIREILLFTLGILLIVYSSMNIAISPAPDNLSDIPNQYGKTFCMPIGAISGTSEEGVATTKKKMNNAYALVILSLISGIFLILISFFGVWQGVLQVERLATSKQVAKQMNML
jgi:hypothetical protein